MSYKILENRLIAYLDVLGFTSFLETDTVENVYNVYSKFMDDAKTKTFFQVQGDLTGRTNFEYAEFISDSLVLVSNPVNDCFNVNNFLAAISYLLEMGFKTDLPLRGAVTRGNFLIDNDRRLFLSKEFAELVHYEGKQEWSGCCILKQAENIVIDSVYGQVDKSLLMKQQFANNMLHFYHVPFKENKTEDLFVINYMIFVNKKDRQKHIDHMIDKKKINTAAYANFITTSPCEVQGLPQDYLPAVAMTFIKSRSGFRAIFYDKENNQCKPGIDKFTWVAVGR